MPILVLNALSHVVLAYLMSGAIFVTSVFYSPKALYALPEAFTNGRVLLAIVLAGSTGVSVGTVFGVFIGLLRFPKPVWIAVMDGLGALIMVNTVRSIALLDENERGWASGLLWSVTALESVFFVFALAAAVVVTRRWSTNLSVSARTIVIGLVCLVALVLYLPMFSIYLPVVAG